jgi:predicted nucleic acid-binding protein
MSGEFVDTNVLVYAHEGGAGIKHQKAVDLLTRVFTAEKGVLSVQVLTEFYSIATKKLAMESEEAERAIRNLRDWTIHRPGHDDIVKAVLLHRRYQMGWWNALILNSAIETGCSILWTEDLSDGQRYSSVTVRNPFR